MYIYIYIYKLCSLAPSRRSSGNKPNAPRALHITGGRAALCSTLTATLPIPARTSRQRKTKGGTTTSCWIETLSSSARPSSPPYSAQFTARKVPQNAKTLKAINEHTDPQVALRLLRACGGICKLVFSSRNGLPRHARFQADWLRRESATRPR